MNTGFTPYYTNFVYQDELGVRHPFAYMKQCGVVTGNGYSSDGMYWIDSNFIVHTRSGAALTLPIVVNGAVNSTNVLASDANGNQISGSSGVFTDTTGAKVLTASGTGTASSPKVLSYLTYGSNPNGTTPASASVTITYKSYMVRTAFGCSKISEYNQTASLVDRITLADGTFYQFGYEATPGYSSDVTGRLASLTLPQGGTISYQYTGGSNGINCADGTPTGITRTITGQSRTYIRSLITTTSSHTDIQDGTSNHSTFDFVTSGTPTAFYETQESTYQGAASGTPLVGRQTCYNATANPCTTTAITLPITQIDTYETLNGIEEHGSTAKYNAYALQTEQDDYDFGGASARGALLRKEVWAYPSTGIPNLLSSDTVYNGSGTEVGLTTYAYDGGTLTSTSGLPQHGGAIASQRGNLTNVTQYTAAGTSLVTTDSYEDTGNPLSVTTPNGTLSAAYEPTTHAYVATATPPTPSSGIALSSAATTDLNTGLPLTSTDPNGAQAAYTSYDLRLRPTEVDSLDSSNNVVGKTTFSYSTNQFGVQTYQSASVNADTETHYDEYGRADRVAVYNGQSGNGWYEQDSCFDANGRLSFTTYSFASTGLSGAKVCSGTGDTYTYDALGRVLTITHADNTKINYSYNGRATETVDENNVTRITQVDSLGRPTVVCEVTSASPSPSDAPPAACSTDISATGYTTNYTYNLSNNTTTVTQGIQTRIFQSDWLGRPTSVQEPESGTTTYSYAYNSTGLVVTRIRPKANQTSATITTTTTTQYDTLNRPVSITYSDGTPTKTFAYDTNAAWVWSNFSPTNLKGRLYLAESAANADSAFSYDSLGRINSVHECLPSGCGNAIYDKILNYSYDWAGNLATSTDGAGVTSTYTVSQANEPLTLTSSLSTSINPSSLIFNMKNGPNGPISYSLGNGLNSVFGYDTLGRKNGGWVCNGSSSPSCSGGTALYGFTTTWQGVTLTNSSDSVLNQASNYGYDAFNRLTSRTVMSGATQNLSWTYDRYGNRLAQNVTTGSGPTPSFSVNAANNQITTMTYDAVGNMTNDGTHTYTYDAEGNITAVDGGATATYVYNALNQRVRTTVGSTIKEFVFNVSGQRVSLWNGSTRAQLQGQYYWGGRPVAYYAGGAIHFQHQDWLGTERLRTTYTGAVEGTFTSLPFGDAKSTTGTDGDAYHFAALDSDSESVTDHAGFRQYSNLQGRWMSPDPYSGSYNLMNPQSFNRYAYAMNNPLSDIDPSGLDDCFDSDGNIVDGPAGENESACIAAGYGWVVSQDPSEVTGVDGDDSEDGLGIDPVDAPSKQTLTKDQCAAAKTVLAREAQYGTGAAARMSSVTFGDQTLAPFNSQWNPNLQIKGGGQLDLDWFTDLSATSPLLYSPLKSIWTLARKMGGLPIVNASPYQDPGEATAVTFASLGVPYSNIFTPAVMSALCHE